MKKLNIFKPGKHTASNGKSLDFSEDHVKASIEAYDPNISEAPIVIGHPKDNGPAFGWVSALSYSDDGMEADVAQLDPEFGEMVKGGRFKKRSASFYHPDSPNNPVPGVFYLRHVGFLGAQPPAVKGLRDVEFNEDEEGVVEFMDDGLTASIFRRMRDFFIEQFGIEKADNVLPDYLVASIEDEARRPAEEATPSFTEQEETTMTPEQIAELQAKAERADALEQENTTLKAQSADFAERETKLKRQETETKVVALIDAGKVLPAMKDKLVDFMMSLDADTTIEFSEEGQEAQSQADFMMDFLEAQPKAVDFNEHDKETSPPADMTAEELSEKALEYQESEREAGRTVTTSQAVAHVKSGKYEG